MACSKSIHNVTPYALLGILMSTSLQAQCTLPNSWLSSSVEQLTKVAQGMMSGALVANLVHEGFSCTDQNGHARGYICTSPPGFFPGYPKRVSLVISKQLASISHYHMHLHGWLLHGATYESTLKDFDFEDRFPDSEKNNSIMIIPESENHSKTFTTYFSKPEALDAMMRKVNSLVGRSDTDITSISLSGHSGAQVPVSMILRDSQQSQYGKKINTVLLFDATYSDQSVFKPELQKKIPATPGSYQYDSIAQFRKWILSGKDRTLVSTYVASSTTEPESIQLKNETGVPATNRVDIFSYKPKPVPSGIDPSSYNHFQICYDQMTNLFKTYLAH